MKFTKAFAPLLVLALVFASCSSKTESASDTQATTTVAQAASTTQGADKDDEPAGADRLVPADGIEIGKSVDYAGWTITFEELTSNEDEKDPDSAFDTTTELELTVKYENLLDKSATPNFRVVLELADADDTVENVNMANADLKEVPGDGNGKGTFAFNLDEDQAKVFDLDRATIVIGEDSYAQARVPLSDKGDLVTLKPQEQKPGLQDIEMGEMDIEVVSTELRWTSILNRDVADKDETWLAVTVNLHMGDQRGRPDDLEWAAAMPDGTTITASNVERTDGKYGHDWADPNTTIKGVIVWFRLEDPVDAEYEFKITGTTGPDGAEVSKTQKVELKATKGDAPEDAVEGDEKSGDADADSDSDSDSSDAKSKDDDSDSGNSDSPGTRESDESTTNRDN